MLRRLRQSAGWVMADLPHYWGAWVCQALDAADEIVVTAVPTLACLRNARSILDALEPRRKNDEPVRVVLNHVGANPKTDIPARDFATTLGRPLAALVPHEPATFAQSANSGRMIAEGSRSKAIIEPLNTLAALVSGRDSTERRAPVKGPQPRLIDRLRFAMGRPAPRAKA